MNFTSPPPSKLSSNSYAHSQMMCKGMSRKTHNSTGNQSILVKKAVIIIRPKYVVSNWICHPLKPHCMLNQSHIRHVNDIMNMIYGYWYDTLTAGLPVKTLHISLWFPTVYQLWLIITHIFALMQAARFGFQSPYMPDLKKWPLVPVWWCQAKQLK